MRPRIVLLAGLFVIPTVAPAQTIYGSVQEDGTSTPVVGAAIELLSGSGKRVALAISDSAGSFLLHTDRWGKFTVRLTHASYETFRSDTISLRRDEVIAVEVKLAASVIALEPLVVVSRRRDKLAGYYYRAQRSGFGRFVERAEIETRPAARATDLLRQQPSVDVIRTQAGVNLITMTGGTTGASGRCQPTIYIDGLKVQQYVESGIDDFLRADLIEGIEIYPRSTGAPAELSDGNRCGVIAFWTRTDFGPDAGNGSRPFKTLGAFLLLVGATAVLAN